MPRFIVVFRFTKFCTATGLLVLQTLCYSELSFYRLTKRSTKLEVPFELQKEFKKLKNSPHCRAKLLCDKQQVIYRNFMHALRFAHKKTAPGILNGQKPDPIIDR